MDFTKLTNNPVGLDFDKKIWEHYPKKLQRRKIFCTIPDGVPDFYLDDLDKLVRFVIVFIDPSSPLAEEKDFEYRIQASMEALNFSTDERFFAEVENDTSFFQDVLTAYFTMVHSLMYEVWVSRKISFHKVNMQLRENAFKGDGERRHTLKMLTDITNELIDLEHSLFPDEETTMIIQQKSSQDRFVGYAEEYALKIPIQ